MKRLIAVIVLVLAAMPVMAQNGAEGRPKLSIGSTSHNFGEVARGESPTHTFIFKNTGSAELRITNVAPS